MRNRVWPCETISCHAELLIAAQITKVVTLLCIVDHMTAQTDPICALLRVKGHCRQPMSVGFLGQACSKLLRCSCLGAIEHNYLFILCCVCVCVCVCVLCVCVCVMCVCVWACVRKEGKSLLTVHNIIQLVCPSICVLSDFATTYKALEKLYAHNWISSLVPRLVGGGIWYCTSSWPLRSYVYIKFKFMCYSNLN